MSHWDKYHNQMIEAAIQTGCSKEKAEFMFRTLLPEKGVAFSLLHFYFECIFYETTRNTN